MSVWHACKWSWETNREQSERGWERRAAALYLVSLFAGKVWGIEGYNLDALLLGAPQPAILLLCPSALRPPGTPSDEGRTTPISLCSTSLKCFHKASKQHSLWTLTDFWHAWVNNNPMLKWLHAGRVQIYKIKTTSFVTACNLCNLQEKSPVFLCSSILTMIRLVIINIQYIAIKKDKIK